MSRSSAPSRSNTSGECAHPFVSIGHSILWVQNGKWNPCRISISVCFMHSLQRCTCYSPTVTSPSPPPSSPSLHPASVVGDPLFDPLFSRGSEGVHDRKADGGEPLITIETEEGLPGSSPSSMLHCVLACSCLPAPVRWLVSLCSLSFADDWPWDHIFRPNVRGRTELACECRIQ